MGSERERDVLISAITVYERSSVFRTQKKKKKPSTYAERDARKVVPAECLDGGRWGRSVANKDGGGAREGRDEAECFEALAEA